MRAIARRYAGRGIALDDIVQTGYIGLIAAVDRFDASRGVPLEAYAARTIEGEIMHLFRDLPPEGWASHICTIGCPLCGTWITPGHDAVGAHLHRRHAAPGPVRPAGSRSGRSAA